LISLKYTLSGLDQPVVFAGDYNERHLQLILEWKASGIERRPGGRSVDRRQTALAAFALAATIDPWPCFEPSRRSTHGTRLRWRAPAYDWIGQAARSQDSTRAEKRLRHGERQPCGLDSIISCSVIGNGCRAAFRPLQVGHQFLCPIESDLVHDGSLNLAIAFYRSVNFDALLTHRRLRLPRHQCKCMTRNSFRNSMSGERFVLTRTA
jgi:hypothetical protein